MTPRSGPCLPRALPVNTEPDALEQAADWHLRLQEAPEARHEFLHWLQADSAHRAAWQRMEQLMGALDHLAPQPVPVMPMPPRRRRYWPGLAVAASLALIAVLAIPPATQAWRADFYTGTGQTREVILADGSSVTLGPESELSVAADNPRHVTLLRGQAFFDVAHDPQRPFVATAGHLDVRVLGTAFEMELQGQRAQVSLARGQVLAENAEKALSERLAPGQTLRLDWPSGHIERTTLAPQQIGAWRQGSLFVENQPVSAIVEQLQRYTPGWIVVADPALKQRRLTGVFDLRDPDRAMLALAQSLNTPQRKVGPWLRTLGNF